MRSLTGPRGPATDDGFTLAELVISVVIIAVITIPLGNVVIGYLRHSDETTGRLLESHDVQIASAYWSQDVASIGTRSTTSPYPLSQSVWTGASSLYPCPAPGTPIVSLAWDEFTAVDVATLVQVVYSVTGTELHRVRCQQSAGVPTVGPDVTLAHQLDPATPPVVTCSTACTAAPAVPTEVDLKLTVKEPNNRGGAYVVTLSGQRRQS